MGPVILEEVAMGVQVATKRTAAVRFVGVGVGVGVGIVGPVEAAAAVGADTEDVVAAMGQQGVGVQDPIVATGVHLQTDTPLLMCLNLLASTGWLMTCVRPLSLNLIGILTITAEPVLGAAGETSSALPRVRGVTLIKGQGKEDLAVAGMVDRVMEGAEGEAAVVTEAAIVVIITMAGTTVQQTILPIMSLAFLV